MSCCKVTCIQTCIFFLPLAKNESLGDSWHASVYTNSIQKCDYKLHSLWVVGVSFFFGPAWGVWSREIGETICWHVTKPLFVSFCLQQSHLFFWSLSVYRFPRHLNRLHFLNQLLFLLKNWKVKVFILLYNSIMLNCKNQKPLLYSSVSFHLFPFIKLDSSSPGGFSCPALNEISGEFEWKSNNPKHPHNIHGTFWYIYLYIHLPIFYIILPLKTNHSYS